MKDTEGVLKGRKKVITPVCRLSYARLLEPAKNLNDEMKYSVSLIFDADCDLSDMKTAAANALIDKWGADKKNWPANLRSPFRDGNEKDDELYQGKVFVNVSSDEAPQVGEKVGNKFIQLTTSDKVYSGMYARVSLNAFTYDKKGNRGVSFGLGNVMKIRDGERLDGRTDGDTDFQEFEGPERTFEADGDSPETSAKKTAATKSAVDLFS